VRVVFDPAAVSYEELLQTFWRIHDPTHMGHQGFDIGNQYRSVVFADDAGQMQVALASREAEQRLRSRPIATEVQLAGPFYPAEPYHQQFYGRGGGPTGAASALTDLASWLALAQSPDGNDREGAS
jgi:peptide-methionine (S)-S-oxide reductase